MIRHRVTIFNPTDSNEDVIKSVSSNFLEIPPLKGFPREDKYIVPSTTPLPPTIKLIRVQWRSNFDYNSQTNPLFIEGQTQQPGLLLYVAPSENVVDADEFYQDINEYIYEIFKLKVDFNWVASATSVFISNQDIKELPVQVKDYTKSVLNLENEESLSSLLDNTSNLDIIIKSDSTTVMTYLQDTSYLPLQKFTVTSPSIKHEIGIFMLDKEITSVDDIMLSGVRFVIDPSESDSPDDKLHKTLFHVKPRHRYFPSTRYNVALEEPVGLHPTLQFKFGDLNLDIAKVAEGTDTDSCKLFYYQLLPKAFFIDKYQLPTQLSLISIYGDTDLEAPEYKIDGWGVEALFEVKQLQDFEFTMHSRYQLPTEKSSELDYVPKVINKPSIFYACNVHEDANLLKTSPFDYTDSLAENIGGYQSYFTENTAFYHLTQDEPENRLIINIPRGKGDIYTVNQLTLMALGLGITWLTYKCLLIFTGRSRKVTNAKKTE
ncbi:protein Pbn1p [[Candida] railenensis]|uniref:Protein PBN1 n=1 Tax=[Candida] railenensis TaxID=45579 RepID=A0A9P0QPG8_9ASCO|nr:protein Pbn1p [[Candida] railenensis]